jgi:hypothetical protein
MGKCTRWRKIKKEPWLRHTFPESWTKKCPGGRFNADLNRSREGHWTCTLSLPKSILYGQRKLNVKSSVQARKKCSAFLNRAEKGL